MRIRVKDLQDIAGIVVTLEVVNPVTTLRGPIEIDEDEDVDVRIAFPGYNSIETTITGDLYIKIKKAAAAQR